MWNGIKSALLDKTLNLKQTDLLINKEKILLDLKNKTNLIFTNIK